MTKNIIVSDAEGNRIGATYPKRAKGLVKSGRAEYTDGCNIRLLDTHASSVGVQNITEDFHMSKIIEFDAREFHFDVECGTNAALNAYAVEGAGMRQHVTNFLDEDEIIFEIGGAMCSSTQIKAVKMLENNTEYVFRFAIVLEMNDVDNAVSYFSIYHNGNQEEQEIYPFAQGKYKPVLSKKSSEGLLRVYEIPFQTGDAESTTLKFVTQNAVTRILPAHELPAYANLPDLTFEQWWEQRRKELETKRCEDYQINLAGAHISQKTMEMLLNICDGYLERLNLAGAHISQAALAVLLEKNKKGVNLAGAHIYEEIENGAENFDWRDNLRRLREDFKLPPMPPIPNL